MTSTEGEANPKNVQAEAGLSARPPTFRAIGTVTVIDSVVVEDANSPMVLRLRHGDFRCSKHVFLVMDEERYEMTIPEAEMTQVDETRG